MSASGTVPPAGSASQCLLANDPLKQIVGSLKTLPSVPELYRELTALLQSDDASLEQAAKIISKDMGMVAKILQVVNSPLYGLRSAVSAPSQAVALLGLDTIKSMVLCSKVFEQFDQTKIPFFSLDVLWLHGMTVGAHAKAIAKEAGADRNIQEETFTAGLLHDVGILILATNLPSQFTEMLAAMQQCGSFDWEAEQAALGCTHGELGGYLLGTWGLPDTIVEAVAFHHLPSRCTHSAFTPLAAVHVADVIEEEAESEARGLDPIPPDVDYLSACGLAGHLPVWRAICLEARSKRFS